MGFGKQHEGQGSFAEHFGDFDPRAGRRVPPRKSRAEQQREAWRAFIRRRAALFIDELPEHDPDAVAQAAWELAVELGDPPTLDAVRVRLENAPGPAGGKTPERDVG